MLPSSQCSDDRDTLVAFFGRTSRISSNDACLLARAPLCSQPEEKIEPGRVVLFRVMSDRMVTEAQ